MDKSDLIEKLRELENNADPEIAHNEADRLLVEFIDDEEVEEAFDKIKKWYL
jgi:hypothetical protein